MGVHRLTVIAALLVAVGPEAVPAQEKKGQKLALLVGVRDYDHPDMRPLRYSENDVVELGKVLKEAGYDVTLLADSVGEKTPALSPSRANIDKHLAEILAKCKRREDTVLIAFAGHGIQPEGDKDAYFCPKDANPKVDAKKTLVSLSKVYAALEESYAGVRVVLVDACRDDPKLVRGRSGITGDNAPRPPRGVAVLFSCAAGEIAYEHEKYQHGVFFHHVLEGLRGKAKDDEDEVTFNSLAAYVSRAVARDVPRLIGDGAQQSPNLKADLAGAPPVLAYLKGATAGAKTGKTPDDKGLGHLSLAAMRGLFDKSLGGPEIAAVVKKLKAPRVDNSGEATRYYCYEDGITMHFFRGKLASLRFHCEGDRNLFISAIEPDRFRQYAGELPDGLTFASSMADVERKLGKPDFSASKDGFGVMSYYGLGLSLSFEFNRLTSVEIRPVIK